MRYHISSWNTHESRFPIGTFTANMAGTALLAIFFALSHAGLSLGYVGCLFLAALSDGFCGEYYTDDGTSWPILSESIRVIRASLTNSHR